MMISRKFVYSYSTTNQKSQSGESTTLVNIQLTPEIVKIEYVGGISNGNLKDANGNTTNKFQQGIFYISVFPAAFINKDSFLFCVIVCRIILSTLYSTNYRY
jgi:hypothetical protein